MKPKRLFVMMSFLSAGLVYLVSLTGILDQSPNAIPERAIGRLGARRPDCGPSCLYVACKLTHKPGSFESICQKAKLTDQGTSMLNLKLAARDLGFQVESLTASAKWLTSKSTEPGTCFLLYIRPQHFILVQRIEGNRPLVIFDPNFDVPFFADESFLTANYQWSGELLVLRI